MVISITQNKATPVLQVHVRKIVAFVLFAACLTQAKAGQLRTVALTGGGLDAPPAHRFADLQSPVINDAGEIAFLANDGLWALRGGELAPVALVGDQAAGLDAGVRFSSFSTSFFTSSIVINASGQLVFSAIARTGSFGTPSIGVWTADPSGVHPILTPGRLPQGAPVGASRAEPISTFSLNDAGDVAFVANYEGSDLGDFGVDGIVRFSAGETIAGPSSGDVVPSMADASYVRFYNPRLNHQGDLVYTADINGPNDSTRPAIFIEPHLGDQRVLAQFGSPLAGRQDDARIGIVGRSLPIPTNSEGMVAFPTHLQGGDTAPPKGQAIALAASDAVEVVVQSGTAVPGQPGQTFQPDGTGFFFRPLMNENGHVAFAGRIELGSTPVPDNVFFSDGGELRSVIQDYADLLGTNYGAPPIRVRNLALNENGYVAFSGLSGRETIVSFIATGSPDTATDLITRTGETIEVAPGDIRTVDTIWFLGNSGNSSGESSAFNSDGEVVFMADFADGSRGLMLYSPMPKSGDYNRDEVVDASDYWAWQTAFGTSGDRVLADGNADGIVDAADYTIWRDALGSGSLYPVPEPAGAAAALVLIGTAAVLNRGVCPPRSSPRRLPVARNRQRRRSPRQVSRPRSPRNLDCA
ncbi:MAG: hypothetical protein RIC11_17995 [Botrimarina sp.]